MRYGFSFKPWPNGLANRHKFAKPELAYGLAMGGQTDLQKGAQSRTFHTYNWLCFYNNSLLAINLGGQTVKNLRLLASKFELDQSQCKMSQVDASGCPNETQVERKSETCFDLQVHLARALDFRHGLDISNYI